TEKTNAEVEADGAGLLHRITAAGESVPIGTTVGLIAATREEYDELTGGASAEEAAGDNGNPFLGYIGQGGGATVAQTAGAAAPEPPRAAPPRVPRPEGALIAPRARTLMRELRITPEDAAAIPGSGPGGRILDRDVAAWAAARASATPGELTV